MAMSTQDKKTASLWDRISSVLADDYSDGTIYVSLTYLDDGDPNTYEFYAYGHENYFGNSTWGTIQGSVNDVYNVWVLGGGAQASRANESTLDKVLGKVCPAVNARPDWCNWAYDWRWELKAATFTGFSAGVTYLLNPTRWGGGVGSVSGCFGYGFVSGFAWQIGYSLFDRGWRCIVLD